MLGTALKERAKIENDSSNDYVLKKLLYTTSWSQKKSIQLDKAVQRSYAAYFLARHLQVQIVP